MIKSPSASLEEGTRLRAGSAVSWGAILAGAVVSVATSLILLALGSGFGFASLSPWPGQGISGSTFAIAGAIWLIVTQWLSAAMGGYIAGRLRHRWLATHTHEVFFRDTAHGLVTWAVATIAVAAVAAGSLSSLAGVATHSMSQIAGAGFRGRVVSAPESGAMMRPDAGGAPSTAYDDVDRLLRTPTAGGGDPNAAAGANPGEARAEAKDAQLRVKAAAEEARKSASQTAIYTALAMLVGAFIASVAAAIGGFLRDAHQ